MIFYIGLLIAIFIIEENDKKRIMRELKKQNNINYCPHCGKKIKDSIQEQPKINNVPIKQEVKTKVKQQTLTDKEIKNNTILITGAILVVLSSIIFLSSSWYNISNILKSFVIIFMTIVFAILSIIANKYNLKDTSKTFMYISLVYLPISLVSLSIFELIGDFFSISGAGKNVYLAMIFFMTSIIYTFINKKYNKIIIFILNIIVQILTVTFTTLIFTNDFMIVLTLILVYNLALIYLYKYSTQFKNNQYYITINIINYLSLITIFIYNLSSLMMNDITIINSIAIIVLLINFYLINTIKNSNIFNYLYPILTTSILFNIANISSFNLSYLSKQIIVLISILIICMYDLIKTKKIKYTSFIEISIVFIIMWFSSLIKNYTNFYLYPYLISYIYTIITFISLVYFDKFRKILTYLFTTLLFLSPVTMYVYNVFDFIYIYILSILVVTIPLFKFINNKFIKDSFSIIGLIFLIISTLMTKFNIIYLILTILTIFIYYIYSNKCNINYKYVIYYLINILLFKISYIYDPEITKYIIPITTIIIITLETLYKKYKDTYNSIYILIQYIISIIILNLNISQLSCIVLLILNLYSIFYILYNKLNKNFIILITVSLIPTLYISDILTFNGINLMYFISYIIIVMYMFIGQNKKSPLFIILSYALLFIHLCTIETSKYLGILVLLILNFYNYIRESKIKDLYLAGIYTTILILFYMLLGDLNLTNYSILKYGILILYLLIITRTILYKYTEDIKPIEYIGLIVINLLALMSYNNEINGILYTSMLVLLTMISYIKKYGPSFLISIIFILINIFLLTREFWFSIPWWLYILIVGIILILFAMNNELKNKDLIKTKLNKIKEKFKL